MMVQADNPKTHELTGESGVQCQPTTQKSKHRGCHLVPGYLPSRDTALSGSSLCVVCVFGVCMCVWYVVCI